ncbi:hypothetical protein [Xenorhabdus sp. PB62.4]|uniref:hypothetical protein n=1 Tax=Xenorhabdus sp. PB62.4 TaxID=1851573 RepID=UPI00165741F0|nr:hypothetical protein [Xenorhabdus sp. PB62.4]
MSGAPAVSIAGCTAQGWRLLLSAPEPMPAQNRAEPEHRATSGISPAPSLAA